MTLIQAGKIFLNALFAGLFIGLAGTVYIAVPNAVVGSFLFAFGLMTILCYTFKLYTGAVGYLMVQKKDTVLSYLVTLLLIWLGNLGGTFFVGTILRYTRVYPKLEARLASVCADKLNDSWSSLLILAFFCGILMYLAVETYRREDLAPVFRFATVFLCVAIFILSGFEHCIANMYYFSAAGVWSCEALCAILLMTLGNSLGGWLIPLADKIRK